jgi:RHS repeat-associated protein
MSTRRLLDIDQDGMPDVFSLARPAIGQRNPWSPASSSVDAYINYGDRLRRHTDPKLSSMYAGLARFTLSDPRRWEVKTDVVDLDGDGMLDLYNNTDAIHCDPDDISLGGWTGCGASIQVQSSADARQGMRLLRRIDNGRGTEAEFSYAPASDTSVVVSEDGYRVPTSLFVVEKLTVTDAASDTRATAEYTYRNPVFNKDRTGRFGFRGFTEAQVTGAANESGLRSRSRDRYAFDLDPTGRPVESDTYIQCDPTDAAVSCLASVSETTWQRHELFDGDVVSYHVAENRAWTCDRAATADDCRAGGALERTIYGWGPVYASVTPPVTEHPDSGSGSDWYVTQSPLPPVDLPSRIRAGEGITFDRMTDLEPNPDLTREPPEPSPDPDPDPSFSYLCGRPDYVIPGSVVPVMYVQCGSRVTETSGDVVAGDRGGLAKYLLSYDNSVYHVVANERRRYVATSDGTESSWGTVELISRERIQFDDRNLPVRNTVWIDAETTATTMRTYYPETGLLRSVQKPEQVAAGTGAMIRFVYGPHQLYAAQTIDELGHRARARHDLATGAQTLVEGPMQPGGEWPGSRMVLDGFGRPVETFVRIDAPGGGYEEVPIATAEYFDFEIPGRVVTRSLIDYGGVDWVRRQGKVDGMGRTLALAVLSNAGLAETAFVYDDAGNVVSMTEPNANDDGPPNVTTTWQHDGLGRVTRVSPAVGAPVEIEYGLLQNRRVEAPTDGSTPKPVASHFDVFGRLTSVVEMGPDGDAVSTYSYDPNNNLHVVQNADDIVTTLEHNFVGRRVAIERGGRMWSYEYDRNGNMTVARLPMPEDEWREWLYETRAVYDDLDRVRVRTVGAASLSDEQLQRYGKPGASSFVTTFHYDDFDGAGKPNSVGRLGRVELPFDGAIDHAYSAEGRLIEQRRSFNIAPFGEAVSDARVIRISYNALGAPVDVEHADHASMPTTTTHVYDDRGLPVALTGSGGPSLAPPRALARLHRNLAGVPTHRYNDYGPHGQNWTYDDLGRVVDHQIRGRVCGISETGCSIVTVGGETLYHDDVGNLQAQTNRAIDATLMFAYDSQHQLTSATSTDGLLYDASFTYTPAGRLDTASVFSGDRRAQVRSRDVWYDYEGLPGTLVADPEAVRVLRKSGTDEEIGTFDYDERGNLIRKSVDGKTWTFTYDGSDKLREACSIPEGSCEVYYYDHTGARMLAFRTAFETEAERGRFWFGATEVEYRDSGFGMAPDRAMVFAALGGMPVARVVDGDLDEPQFLYSGVLSHLLAVLNEWGDVEAAFAYSPFGELLHQSGSEGDDFHRLFNGKELDDLTELSYYGFRYYDRLALTWTQRDPLYAFVPDLGYDEPRRMGLYTFVLNNPLRHVDPDGLDPVVTPHPNGKEDDYLIADDETGEVSTKEGEKWGDAYQSSDSTEAVEARARRNAYTDKMLGTANFISKVGIVISGGGWALTTFGPAAIAVELGDELVSAATGSPVGLLPSPGDVWRGLNRLARSNLDNAARGCFVAGTVVATADGVTPIEDLQVGDLVLARDELTGEYRYDEVANTFVRYDAPVVKVVVRSPDGQSELLETTAEHPFWVEARGWVRVRNLEVGSILRARDGRALHVASVNRTDRTATVHNIEVTGSHTYFVGELGTWVHNKGMRARTSKIKGGPKFGDLKDHARRHGIRGQTPNEYYNAAVEHMRAAQRFKVRHGGRTKAAFVTRTGPDSFTFTSASQSGKRIYTHMYDVNMSYLRNKGITLPEGF